MMESGRGYCPKSKVKGNVKVGLNQDAILIIKLPDSKALRIMSRSLFLAMFLLALPSIRSILRGSFDVIEDEVGFNALPVVLHDLVDEGLVKKGHKGLILSSEKDCNLVDNLAFFSDNVVDLVIDSDVDQKNSIPNEALDFAVAWSTWDSKFVDRVLKIGGIVVTPLNNDELKALTNYRIVYVRRFDKTLVGLRKIGTVDDELNSRKRKILCGNTQEDKKVVLNGLEDVLYEPPRKALVKSISRKMRFLPELLGDSLGDYPRRVFISDEKNGVAHWFQRNYPAKVQDFEMYNLVSEDHDDTNAGVPSVGVAEWLRQNVKEEDYVVMKAEAELVEEIIKKKAICLVDELFLHCGNQLDEEDDAVDVDVEKENRSKRAYWQCLTLYGKLIDEGVAVHQWWN